MSDSVTKPADDDRRPQRGAAEHVRGRSPAGPVDVLAFKREQRDTVAARVNIELAEHILDEPAQAAVGAVDQRN